MIKNRGAKRRDLWKNISTSQVWRLENHWHFLGIFEDIVDAMGILDKACSEECEEAKDEVD